MTDRLRDLLADEMGTLLGTRRDLTASDLLTAHRIPWLCSDCEGSGEVERDTGVFGTIDLHVCDHPYAPTIGKLLAIGEAVMHDTGKPWPFTFPNLTTDHTLLERAYFWRGVDHLRRYLRSVEP